MAFSLRSSIAKRRSHLNAALVRDWHQRLKFRCLSVSFPSFSLDQMCLSRSFRWHYMRSARVDFTVYGFSLFGYFVGADSFVLLAF
ncbi:hypothetical protein CGJ87_24150 [Vibrio parahaemolyticus]|nr:hypothetical protein CGJ87_24150 [Vibrio parahaemolyticus]TOD02352.1 hypothetical protein CGJ71_23575 [Vibrio parahaemolyticus]TOD07231.1 hypothetical protein CGJ73_23880 [Vibrio parahaemolyticus]TOD08139.1 hypothetical protein CGJ72_22860 [Vibrio parahaemolyticus]TOD08509.1 hypothetical protein CGJ70_22685 [Vibrio parahaemolyticus]